jgi:hypothetical protein
MLHQMTFRLILSDPESKSSSFLLSLSLISDKS